MTSGYGTIYNSCTNFANLPTAGRSITVQECNFVFTRVWKATVEGNEQSTNLEINPNELFHIIDLAGTLMNKKNPDDDDETPFMEFEKYAKIKID